ncbi:hypothetical protein OHT76_04140 [Streptomyces sp. NBC_00287]|uniref:hypothetical protein n=1 Tax=Streptomyces sp. NBC_00287 TaxID=2975702 RepID=UPI002E2BCB76|nr:hypothetical protein [Streptomyces sp. NBC_00287]
MNKEPSPQNRKTSPPPHGAAPRRAAQGMERAERGRTHAEAAGTAGIRLDLPIQGATIERRWDLYQPYLRVTGTYQPVDQPEGTVGEFLEEPGPRSMTGHVPADPAPSAGRDARGWACPPSGPCTWVGLV